VKDFLRKIKLVQDLSVQIEMNQSDFEKKLNSIVDKTNMGYLFDILDIFSSSKNLYKGQVDAHSFKIRRKKQLFDMRFNIALASGEFKQQQELLIIETEINGFRGVMVPFLLFVPFFYIILFISLIFSNSIEGEFSFAAIPFLLFHATFMIGVPYLVMRRSIRYLKRELEREFSFLSKKDI